MPSALACVLTYRLLERVELVVHLVKYAVARHCHRPTAPPLWDIVVTMHAQPIESVNIFIPTHAALQS
jgi:hypothetical protein